jgi:hypothetical protein
MGAPSYTPPPVDPTAVAADQQAQVDQIGALQTRAQGDSASLMARYGMLALAGASKAPGVP